MSEMLLGRVLVPDITDPRPQDVDAEFMLFRLGEMRRFSGHRSAMTVREHQRLVALLAASDRAAPDVVEWAGHHDDHEYATGDIVTPMQKAFGMERIRAVQARWDIAICGALGLKIPTAKVAAAVARYDAIALAMEWRWCLGRNIGELRVSDDIAARSRDRYFVQAVWGK